MVNKITDRNLFAKIRTLPRNTEVREEAMV